jgi:hypothetical protein
MVSKTQPYMTGMLGVYLWPLSYRNWVLSFLPLHEVPLGPIFW